VYTSGKGSSAAGLTASVIRDSSTVCNITYLVLFSPLLGRFYDKFLCRCFDNFVLSVTMAYSGSFTLKEVLWFLLMEALSALMNLTKCDLKTGEDRLIIPRSLSFSFLFFSFCCILFNLKEVEVLNFEINQIL
jgi:hypothetical protein